MRNYIILNNQRSDEISGLIIQELAPISKPLQRTQVETIDGRDGDIVTPLGYAAYDKKITIGLYGNFDINEIIAYFATQGTAIFSNEPDKYYNYQILDQIDYDRLVRYRVATVTMHVQPFKYSATEGTITVDASDTVTGEGSDIALDGTAEAPFNTLDIKGNAEQTGTPTPDSPQPISTVTGDQNIKVSGKNLMPVLDGSITLNGVTATVADGILTLNGTSTASSCIKLTNGLVGCSGASIDSAWLNENVTNDINGKVVSFDYLSGTAPSSSWAFRRFSTSTSHDQQWLAVLSDTSTAFSTDGSISCLAVFINANMAFNNYKVAIQLELGNQATDYEEFKGQSYVIPFGDTYLAKIGNYADEPVKVGDTWYIRRKIGKLNMADIRWDGLNGMGNPYRVGFVTDYGAENTATISNIFAYSATAWDGNGKFGIASSGSLWMMTGDSTVDASNAPSWLANKNAVMYYVLATPTDEEITDQDLIDALDALYDQAHSYKGHTHITATAADGNAPAVLSVEVGEDNESTVTNAGNTASRPIITIYGQGDIGVYINDVEVLDIALGNEQYITLDSTEMDAYKDSPANLKNRLVTGDYSKLALNAGANKIRFTGNVTKYEISKYSRWL